MVYFLLVEKPTVSSMEQVFRWKEITGRAGQQKSQLDHWLRERTLNPNLINSRSLELIEDKTFLTGVNLVAILCKQSHDFFVHKRAAST